MSLANVFANNTIYADDPRNLIITNDLTTGNILFTSERHNIPPQVLGTLVAEEDPRSSDSKPRIRIKRMNDDGTLDRYLIRKKIGARFFCFTEGDQAPSRISMATDRATLVTETLDYLNALFTEVPATTSIIMDFGPDDTLDASRDATNTTVLFDNGKEHAVNAIQAVENDLGFIDVVDHATQQIHFRNIRADKVSITGAAVSSSVTTVVNALNALFTVNPLGTGYEPVTILPTVDGVAVTYNQAEETTPVTSDPNTGIQHLQSATGNDSHGSRFWSNEVIDQAGEYFDVKITGRGQFLLGFYEKGVDEVELAAGTSGNHHTGMYWSLSLYNYGSYMGPHTIYGSNPGLAYGPGWNGAQLSRYATNQEIQDNHNNLYANLWRIGIDQFGYIYVAYYDAGRTNDFIMVARKSSTLNSGTELGLAIKFVNGTSTLVDVPLRTAVDPTGPALSYRYIESPDGEFYYPLFASADEAAYVDVQNGGADPGSAHAHTFVDEPTGTIWYMPDNGGTHAGPSAPSDTSEITYTEIPTLDDAQFAPAPFTLTPITANEGDSINISLHPTGSSPDSFTTTVDASTLPSGIVNTGAQNRYLQGTLPNVSADTQFDVLVTRTNAYGSTQAYQTINVVDVPLPVTGWTVHQGNHLGGNVFSASENAVLSYDTPISRGTRVRINFEPYMKLGIVTAAGDSIKTTGDLFDNATKATNFQLLVTVWATHIVNHNNNHGVGWDFNNAISQPVASNNDVYFLDYKDDGYIEFTNSDTGEVLLTSQLAFSGDLTLFSGTPNGYNVNTTIPSITTEDLTYAGDAINGFTKDNTGEDLVDASTMTDGSVVSLDAALDNNFRLIIRKEWLAANVLPGLASASGISQFFIGFPIAGVDWTALSAGNGNVAAEDFKLAFGISMSDTGHDRNAGYKIKLYKDGTQVHNANVTATPNTFAVHDLVFSYVDGRMEMGMVHTGLTNADTLPREENGGAIWSYLVPYNGFGTGPQTLFLGAQNTTADLALSGIDFVREPFLARDIIVGETSTGAGKYTGLQPAATEFENLSNGHAAFTGTLIPPTLAAGQTYRFIYHPSFEATDKIEFRLASDDTTVYTTGVTEFGSGDPGSDTPYKGVEFAVPADVPPLKVFQYNNHSNGSWNTGNEVNISGSTYSVPITGITLEGPSGNVSGSTVTSDAWYRLNEPLSAGERMIINGTVLRSMFEMIDSDPGTQIQFNARDINDWSENAAANASGLHDKWVRLRKHGSQYNITFFWGSASLSNLYLNTLADVEDTIIFYNLTASGNNVRHGMINDSNAEGQANSLGYSEWSGPKDQTGDQGYGLSEVQMQFRILPATSVDVNLVDWASIYDIVAPATPTITTPWTKALKFDGNSENAVQQNNANAYNPLRMAGNTALISAHSDLSKTSDHIDARPWAVACVFRIDGNASNQHIWNQGEGTGSNADNIYLRLDAAKRLYFGWGRDNGQVVEMDLGFTASENHWYGVYVAHKGQRFDASNATAPNLADAFDIRVMGSTTLTGSTYRGQFTELSSNLSTDVFWNLSGSSLNARTDRTIEGTFTVGGRGSNRTFHGYVASCVVTTLERDVALPSDAEIKKMITDPEQWATDKDAYRPVGSIYSLTGFDYGNGDNQMSWATQVWLMGDSGSDAYATIHNGVKEGALPTQLTMSGMVANDIETVSIPGLS